MTSARKNLSESAAPVGSRPTVAPDAAPDIGAMVESIVGCKWSLHVLEQIRRGVARPGALQRSAEGLTSKVLSERLDKMVRFGLVERTSYPEVPPRVEYTLTPLGRRFTLVLDEIEKLKGDAARGTL